MKFSYTHVLQKTSILFQFVKKRESRVRCLSEYWTGRSFQFSDMLRGHVLRVDSSLSFAEKNHISMNELL